MSAQYLQNFIRNYADRLRLEGFNVFNILDDVAQMPSFNGVKPSIYAWDESLERIIVVKTEQEYEDSGEELEKLKEYTREHQLASFWGFITSEKSWRLEENLI